MIDLKKIRESLISEKEGFFVIRSLYSTKEVDEYRQYCEHFINKGPRIHTRINTDNIFDFVHPRSHDNVDRTSRIYQFFHNHKDGLVAEFLKRSINIRDDIEKEWEKDALYRSERDKLQNYTIVTSYRDNYGMLPVHKDYDGPAPFPLIQFWVLLSTPGEDYIDGNLKLHTREGQCIALERDLSLKPGDAVIFDKSLYHEVEATKPGTGIARGRWTVLIGARAERDSFYSSMFKRIRYSDLLDNLAKKVKGRSK